MILNRMPRPMILSSAGVGWQIARLMVTVLWLSFVMPAHATPDVSLLKKNGCAECHRLNPEAPLDSRKGPDLFFAGDKFQADWLTRWLQEPVVIRLSGFITDTGFLKGEPTLATPHPKLDLGKAEAVTGHLMQLRMEGLEDAPSAELNEPLSKGKRFKYKILFEREYGCIACHQSVNLAYQPRGGVSGPSLLSAGDRLKADWVYRWLKNPKKFEKRGRMPLFEFNEEELQALTRYVVWHKQSEGQ